MTTATRAATAIGAGPPEAPSRRVRVPQLAVGLLLMAGTALGFVLWNAASTTRTPVVTLAMEVARGEVLTADHLAVAYIGTDDPVATLPADGADALVGRVAVTDLPAGTFVVEQQFVSGAALTPGAGVVGLALGPGQYPMPQLRVGDLVNVIATTEAPGGGELLVEAAEVVWVEPVGTQGQRFVSLLTGEPAAGQIATAAANGEIRLVLVARGEEGSP